MTQDKLAPGPQKRYDVDTNEDSLALLQDMHRHYGNTCRVPSLTRGNDSVVIHHPDDIRRVLLTNRNNYVKGAGLERVRMLLGNGLVVSDGEFWARQRHMIQPAFQASAIRGFSPLVNRVNVDLIERWSHHAAEGELIDLTTELSVAALDIVLRALFSSDFDRLIQDEGQNPFDLLTRDSRRDLPFAARFRALTRFVRAMVDTRRQEHRVEPDLLSMLMEARDKDRNAPMPDRALLDEVMTLIVAGHETTASSLNWTWYLLSQHPTVQAHLHAEVAKAPEPAETGQAEPGPSTESSLVENVLQESLRLYPPVWLFSRRAIADDILGGYRVPSGTDVFICPYLLHRHPAHWENPEAFVPARFTPTAAAGRHRFAFLPFSAGPRFCIGSGFAMAEMATHLTMVTRRFRLEYAGPSPAEAEFQINLRTRHALQMRLVAR